MNTELAVRNNETLAATDWNTMKEQAKTLIASGFLPKAVNTPEKAIAIAMKGRELGLPMMQAITSIHVIDGKPTISAELMAALVFQKVPGSTLNCIESTSQKCTYEAGRPGGKKITMSFTWEDATRAGVTTKDNWRKYPAAMLRARACSAICRVVFPDAIMGTYTPDELGAVTTEEGEIVDTSKPLPQIPQGSAQVEQSREVTAEEIPFEEVPEQPVEQKAGIPLAPADFPSENTIVGMVVEVAQKPTSKKGSFRYRVKVDEENYFSFDKKNAEAANEAFNKKAYIAINFLKGQYGNDIVKLAVL